MAIPAAAGYLGGKLLGKGAPKPPNYSSTAREQANIQRQLLDDQTRANRPNQSTPFANSEWVRGPDGQWQQRVSLNGGLGEAANALQGQVAEQMRQPLDLSTLPQVGTGEDARREAFDAAFGQAKSRLDPMFRDREEKNRTRLLNQGLAEGSEAYNKAMDRLGMERNDAYQNALNSAIGQSTQAGQALFQQNMAARNQAFGERQYQHNQPLADLQRIQGFTATPGFQGAGMAQAPNLLGAAGMQYGADMQRWAQQQQMLQDAIGSAFDLTGQIGTMFASDERLKTHVERLPMEVAPGVPAAIFRYKENMGPPGLYSGVIAQDLQRHCPEAVHTGEDGLLYVGGAFMPTKIGD